MMNNYRDVCLVSSRKVGKKLCVEPRSSDEVPQLLEQFFSLAVAVGGLNGSMRGKAGGRDRLQGRCSQRRGSDWLAAGGIR